MEQDDRKLQGHHLQVNLNGEKIIDHQLDKKGEGKNSGVSDRPLEGYISCRITGTQQPVFSQYPNQGIVRAELHAPLPEASHGSLIRFGLSMGFRPKIRRG